jgi:phenylpropionate dioxygenase-like ring-hydroxylating dioxygenase large terminal subunit
MRHTADELLRVIAENSARDFSAAQSLPPEIYHHPDILQRETKCLFHRGWICVGRTAEIPTAGDYISVDIVDQPVFVIRQKDNSVSAFPNVCLHRCSRLLEDRGRVSRISCPYHSWTYNLDGQLIGAPFMQQTANFDVADYKLEALACDIWQGFIYVNEDRNALPLSGQLAALDAEVADYRMADYVPVFEAHDVWDANWKCLVENFMDVYHLHKVHATSFGKYGSFEDVTTILPGNDAFAYMYVQEEPSRQSVTAHAVNTWLKGDMRLRTYVINIYPGQTIQLQPDMLWYLSIQPRGVDKVSIRWAVSIPKEILDNAEDRQAEIDSVMELLHQVNSEDKKAIESVFRATKSRVAKQGPLSYLERNCWDFGRYLARELGSDSR